jgi:tetratricopeptide (TPR) repeat protein
MDLEIGKKLIQEKKFDQALSFFLNELEKGNKSLKLYFFLGFIYFELNQIQNSINYYNLALKLQPQSIDLILRLANANYVLGNFLSAKNLYLKVIKLNPYNPSGYYGLYLINPQHLTSKYIPKLIKIKDKTLNLNENYLVEYLLSKIAKQKNDYEAELKHLKNYQKNCFKSKNDHNLQGLFYYSKVIPQHFNKIKFNKNLSHDFELKNISPIFIIGLPRSGSTLVESIISAAKDNIISLGETSIFNTSILNQIKYQIFQKNFEMEKYTLNINVNELKKDVLNRYQNYLPKNNKNFFFIDKSLENFFNIDSILNIFPNALFINTKRNFNDSTIAIYQAMLPDLPWTHSILDILDYTNNYIKIISFFKQKYSNQILTIDLEGLTNNQEIYTKKIFEFCNLTWTPEILKFYKKKDLMVKTLSNNQIRGQIYSYNQKKYKSYEKLLETFKDKYDWLN